MKLVDVMVSYVRANSIFGMNALKTNQILRSLGILVTSFFVKSYGYNIFLKSRLYERSYNQTVSLELPSCGFWDDFLFRFRLS